MRLTPASRNAESRPTLASSGFTSAVTSAPGAMGKASRTTASRPAICAGESMEGVPPPRKTVLTKGWPSASPQACASRSSAAR